VNLIHEPFDFNSEQAMNEDFEIRQFVFDATPAYDMMAIIELNDSGIPITRECLVQGVHVRFRDLPIFTFFWADDSEKVLHNGFYVKITTREGLLLRDLRGETIHEMTRVRFSPEYQVIPQSAQIILEQARPVSKPQQGEYR
jgi:hypothetical protein